MLSLGSSTGSQAKVFHTVAVGLLEFGSCRFGTEVYEELIVSSCHMKLTSGCKRKYLIRIKRIEGVDFRDFFWSDKSFRKALYGQ